MGHRKQNFFAGSSDENGKKTKSWWTGLNPCFTAQHCTATAAYNRENCLSRAQNLISMYSQVKPRTWKQKTKHTKKKMSDAKFTTTFLFWSSICIRDRWGQRDLRCFNDHEIRVQILEEQRCSHGYARIVFGALKYLNENLITKA